MENNLRKFRKAKKMKMEQVAKLAGCSVSTLIKLESGERNLSNEWVAKFSEIYGVMPYELSDDPDYVFKIDNLEKMIQPVNDKLEKVSIATQDGQEIEMLRIFKALDYKGKAELLLFGYQLEKDATA